MSPGAVDARPDAALRHYALQSPVVVERSDVGYINDNWLVADGATGQRYVLRTYLRVRDAGRIVFQLAFQEHLAEHGFPTARVVKTRGGELSACSDGTHWALFDFVDGEEFDFASLAQAREAGSRLAQFEAIAATYQGPVVPPPVREVDSAKWLAPVSSHVWRTSMLADEHQEQLQELFAGAGLDGELAYVSRWHRAAGRAWPAERLAALPQAWLHCDYHGRNMAFRGDTLAGLFDFDFLSQGPRTFDISRALVNFGRERRGSTALRVEFCHAFLEGFESLAPLDDEERRSLPVMAVLNWAPDAAFCLARQQDVGGPGIGEQLQFAVRIMRAVEDEMGRLASRFGWELP